MPDGTLAGSTLTMLDAVLRVAALGVPAATAIRHATSNPATVIGAHDRGRLAPGARADVLALDPDTLALRGVWVGGEHQAQREGPDIE
jgi:N-acetylglucosamine-6-phosphate deacetylase